MRDSKKRSQKKNTHTQSLSLLEHKEAALALVLLYTGLSDLLTMGPTLEMMLGSHTRLFTAS